MDLKVGNIKQPKRFIYNENLVLDDFNLPYRSGSLPVKNIHMSRSSYK
jgi:hypothetical protein